MPFVYERISEKDSEAVCWEQYKEYQNPWSVIPTHWTIDRDLDVFIWLIRSFIPGWPNQIFGLSWKGDARLRVEFIETTDDVRTPEGILSNSVIRVVRVDAPGSLGAESENIRSAVEAALEAYIRRLDSGKARVVSFV